MRRSSLYFAFRSDRHGAPVLIWPAPVATARSARKSSSVSPDRWEMTARYPALCAISTASSASESVPIWFTLIRTAFAVPSAMPQESLLTFVTNRSSPTSCTLFPSASVSCFQPSKSSSHSPSSMDTIGYFSRKSPPPRLSSVSSL